ncbi:DUF4215 domain-containing protein [Enhygromyxa salina]|uniref:DUF4215 domain-containing protein n=1 Tax=Enhygromyxa salina TaxID=215803 RepID=UPI0015E665B6|nr:DUF4215 domain-containing protein [Enhygromyxa salina]
MLTLSVGLTLGACQTEPLEADTGTEAETGTGTEVGDGDGDTGDGDGDGDPGDGDGDGDPGDGDGDGDGDPQAECGNGELDAGEACDDGNDVEEDACTSACELAACGDGYVQPSNDEVCDDGNTDPGDACTASCVVPGAVVWESILDYDDAGDDDVGVQVVLDSGDNIDILISTNGNYRLSEYAGDGTALWSYPSLATLVPSLAVSPDDTLVVGGSNGNQGATRMYDTDGNSQWTQNVPVNNSRVLGVAVDDMGFIVAGGYHANDKALLFRDDNTGTEDWSNFDSDGVSIRLVAVGPDGQSWAMRSSPRQLETYTAAGAPAWVSAPLDDAVYADLAVDGEGNSYLLSAANDGSLLTISKYDSSGELSWTVDHDDPGQLEAAGGLAVLPGGGVLVSGSTNGGPDGADGLLAWYDADGDTLIPDIVVDGDAAVDLDVFVDVVIGDGYAVAVGGHHADGQDGDLWIRKFEI